jgi:hypothetical protein
LILGVVVLAGAGAVAWRWLVGTQATAPPAAGAQAPPTPRTLAPSPPEPAVANPIEPGVEPPGAPTTEELQSALGELVGNARLQSLFRLQDLPRRIVTTVDNLGRAQASASLWPVNPPTGPFTTDRSGEAEVIAAGNDARYAPYVELLESVDLDRATMAYRRLYPLFQQAYEDLGYPDRYFNDRLVEVIDLLLVTPEPRGALRVRLPEFSEEVRPERPWVLYRFEDPALQELAAGPRMLLRMGPENRRRVKQVLTALRPRIAATPPPRALPAAVPAADPGVAPPGAVQPSASSSSGIAQTLPAMIRQPSSVRDQTRR